ncbi:MAG TPA: maltose alpha-D-glucosyltransferase, partial [Flavisolibacter sp.]|nr:maltose alpha-D-glucosyltransferase [Flavisolibacter sp.]
YYTINPRYGTMDQFKEFLNEAHKRNLKVITELVINHTSDQHPWFQRARTAPKGSPERDFYVWTDDPNQYKDVRIIFQDFEASNWTWDPVAQQYYWHRFFHHQPDLNFDNPAVQNEIFRIIDYWCDIGVDGFRLDAIPYLFEREGTNGENLPETHTFLKRLRRHIDEHYPGKAFLAEANMWPEDSASYFGNGDECHMNYHFPVMPRMFMALQQEDRYPITDIFDQTPDIPDNCQWAIFLRNHDELTLEMVTDEERDFMYKVYVKDPKARINLGIRHRLAPLMENNRSRIELMNSLLFSLPGTPVIYYGDEIGMGDNFYLGDRDGVRTPMQWSPDRNAGFSEANPQQLYLPVILDPEYHYEAVNVEMQRRNTSSLLWFMKRMINMRKNYKAFSRGDMKFLQVENPKILAFTRSYEDETLLIIANLSKYAQPAEIDLREFKGYIPVEMFSKNAFPMVKEDQPYFFTLNAHSFQWFVLQNVRTRMEEMNTLPLVSFGSWEAVVRPEGRRRLEETVLEPFLNNRRWFKGKDRKIYGISIVQYATLPTGSRPVYLLLVEVSYESGLPETYQLSISYVTDEDAQRLSTSCPESILAHLQLEGRQGLLCDAFYLPEMQQFLIRNMRSNRGLSAGDGQIDFRPGAAVADHVRAASNIVARMHTGDENNTSITYDNRFFLKMFRKLDRSVNPDVEMNQFLSEQAGFQHIPAFLGTVEWATDKGTLVLGMMQAMIENHGDGESYMQERIVNYVERISARERTLLDPHDRRGSLVNPVGFDELPEELGILLGNRAADQARLIGLRTAQLHLALANAAHKDFSPEEYSLHYQRSLFSAMQSLVRESFQSLSKNYDRLPAEVKKEAPQLIAQKDNLLNTLRRIYTKKLDISKIRIHGTYGLKKLLLTGKDVVIHDFAGNPLRSYSERRIKRSPVRDIAEMVTSFYYTAYEGFYANGNIPREELAGLMPFADQWAHYMSGFFLKAYYEAVEGSSLIPADRKELEVVLNTFLLEKALVHLGAELNARPARAVIPIKIIKNILGIKEPQLSVVHE